MAPHTVKQQDNSTQAVAGSVWRAKDSAERSCVVLPSGYLERQQKTKRVDGGTWAHPKALTPYGVENTIYGALCKKQA